MKKTLLGLITLTALGASAQYGDIPNGGFEFWTTDTVSENIQDWTTVEEERPGVGALARSTDAVDGQYSLRLNTLQMGQDTIFGYAIYGGIGQNGPDQHMYYPDQIDSLTFWMKHSMASDQGINDSLLILVSRVQGANSPVTEIFNVGGIQNTWTRYSFPLQTMAQDSILFGFASSNAFVFQGIPGSYMMVDDVRFTSASGTPSLTPNHSFENWNFGIVEDPDSLYTLNQYFIGMPGVPVNKTTDAYSGTYAATIETMQIGPDTVQGLLLNAPLVPGQQPGAAPYTAQPTALEGVYKYSAANGDVNGAIMCAFYDGGTIVAQPFFQLSGTVGTYTTFSVPINLAAAPDSMALMISSGSNPGSKLWLDDLALTGGNVGYQDLLSSSKIDLYPNPAEETVFMSISVEIAGEAELRLLTIDGRVVQNERLILLSGENTHRMDVSNLANGTYIIRIESNGKVETRKLMVR